jgi:hypothetical protein
MLQRSVQKRTNLWVAKKHQKTMLMTFDLMAYDPENITLRGLDQSMVIHHLGSAPTGGSYLKGGQRLGRHFSAQHPRDSQALVCMWFNR